MAIDIIQMPVGPMENLSYLVIDLESKDVAIVDPGWEADKIWGEVQSRQLNLVAIWLTHGHFDHVNEVPAILARKSVPVYISASELTPLIPNVPGLVKMESGYVLKLGQLEIDVIETPGHSPGCVCFRVEQALITGDTLFVDGCGRWDLPGGNLLNLYASFRNQLMKLPDDLTVYPGHDYGPTPTDTLGHQKISNPVFKRALES